MAKQEKEIMRKTIGERIKLHRVLNGLTQDKLAKKLGYSHGNSVLYWENGQRPVPMEKIADLAEIFGITPNELLAR